MADSSAKVKGVQPNAGKTGHPDNAPIRTGKTLALNWPFGLSLLKAIVLLSVVVLSTELVLRIPVVRRQLPPPVLGTGNLTFDVTWEYLQRTRGLYGHVDCMFVGSSMIKHAIEPELFQKRFREKSGHDIVCFNFGVSGMRSSEAGFYKSMVERYHPSLIVCELTPLILYKGFLENQKSPLISQSPWGCFQLGKFSVKGWLLTHSLLFRYFMRLNMWIRSPSQYERLKRISRNMKMDGFLVKGHGRIGKKKRNPVLNRVKATLSGKVENTQALEDLLDVFSENVPVVFLEMPLKGEDGSFRGEEDRKFSLSRVLLRKVVEERGYVLFSPGEQTDFDKSCWMSINHLNPQGAKRFTPVFADALANALSTGRLEYFGGNR
ncbi:MAG: hypothetical protein GXO70_08780 [Acidobacteria bacterium]|nr:hypothetical protein [Acidobacteriota bacterium]